MRKRDFNLLTSIYKELKNNQSVTENYLMNKYECSERTIRRYIKILKDNKYIELIGYGRNRRWNILK